MQKENFDGFVGKHIDKDVVVTVKNPKMVVKGVLTVINNEIFVKNKEVKVLINHEKTKTISVVINKKERERRRKEKYVH